MEVSSTDNVFMWVEFLLDKKRLKEHLNQDYPGKNPRCCIWKIFYKDLLAKSFLYFQIRQRQLCCHSL